MALMHYADNFDNQDIDGLNGFVKGLNMKKKNVKHKADVVSLLSNVKNELTREQAIDRIENIVLADCHEHSNFDVNFIDKCLASYTDDAKDYNDSDSVMLLSLKDGKYAIAWEWGDSTGHG